MPGSTVGAERRIRLLVVDDHVAVREGIAGLLSGHPGLVVVGQAGDRETALHGVIDLAPDVVLLDLWVPGGGVDLIGQLLAVSPSSAVVVLTMHPADRYRAPCLAAGASAFLGKGCSPSDLVSTILLATRGRAGPPPARAVPDRAVPDRAPLSPREIEVVRAIAGGRTSAAIAADLGIGVRSVATFRRRALGKIGARSNADLVRWVVESGID